MMTTTRRESGPIHLKGHIVVSAILTVTHAYVRGGVSKSGNVRKESLGWVFEPPCVQSVDFFSSFAAEKCLRLRSQEACHPLFLLRRRRDLLPLLLNDAPERVNKKTLPHVDACVCIAAILLRVCLRIAIRKAEILVHTQSRAVIILSLWQKLQVCLGRPEPGP